MRSNSSLAADPRYFEKLIQTHLLDNVHRTTLRFKPDPEIGRRFDEEEKNPTGKDARVSEREQIAGMVENTRTLNIDRKLQTHPKPWKPCPSSNSKIWKSKNKTIPIESP